MGPAARITIALLATVGCDDTAVVLEIRSDLAVPDRLDGLCVSVVAADAAARDSDFARSYSVPEEIDSLPRTLTVLPGDHAAIAAWARAYRRGVEQAHAGTQVTVEPGSIVHATLALPTCPPAGAPALRVAGTTTAPALVAVVALGWRGPTVIAFGDDKAARLRAGESGFVALEAGVPAAAGGVAAALAVDVDGDCDDDLLVAPVGAAPQLWRQDGAGELALDGAALPALGPATALAAADVDADGAVDLVIGGGAELHLLRGDGAGRFAEDAAGLPEGAAADVTALAFADVNRDGEVDLVIGQGGAAPAPLRLLLNDPAHAGFFTDASALVPTLAQRARALATLDADGDGDVDLVVAGVGAPVRLYLNRGDGRLEDRTSVRLPSAEPVDAVSVAAGDLDGDCRPDIVVGMADGTVVLWRGTPTGAFEAMPSVPDADGASVSLADADGDGHRDLLLAGSGGLTWIAPR